MNAIPVGLEALSPDFIRHHSRFPSLQHMLDEHGLSIASGQEQLDSMVRTSTAFNDWQDMFREAARVMVSNNLAARLRSNGSRKRYIR
ncbi:hypothetical protein [Stenotrophomonas sp. NY11291]|uniref:hypothetical protein n=1 Tax=Stenotrophomonas sp. NY11291 TaxID=2939415 RepID=UPI00200BE588|nr:hypothetical protein [Stenotrophomonas sp. NY11291]UQA21492.1 hypothetical protein M1L61_17165 [Stenotrophomonas sp. NY11291]